jgi:hypothetical protein
MTRGATKLQMYNSMQIQLLTIRIHMAVSLRPMYTLLWSAFPGRTTFQSVRSMATYMAPMAKIRWNHEYWWCMVRELKGVLVDRTNVVSCPSTFVITSLADDFVLVLILLPAVTFLIECRSRDSTVSISAM